MPYQDHHVQARPHHHVQQGAPGFCATSCSSTSTAPAGAFPSRDDTTGTFMHGYNKLAANLTPRCMDQLDHDINTMVGSTNLPSTSGFDASNLAFDQDSFNGIFNARRPDNIHGGGGGSGGGRGGDGLTRDFLGLRGFPNHRDFSNMAGFDQMGSQPYDDHRTDQNQAPWQS